MFYQWLSFATMIQAFCQLNQANIRMPMFTSVGEASKYLLSRTIFCVLGCVYQWLSFTTLTIASSHLPQMAALTC